MIHFCKQSGQFKPISKSDIDAWNKIKEGKVYCMRYRSDRNAAHHRKLYAIAEIIIANSTEGSVWENKTPYQLIKATEIPLGYVDEVITMSGEITFIPQSTDFEHWPQEIFEEFYDKAVDYWCSHFGYDREVLESNSMEII